MFARSMSRRPRLLAAPLLAVVVIAGCGGGGDDQVDTKDAQATLRREVGPFTSVLPKQLNHSVTSLDCPGKVDEGAAYKCDVSLSDGLAGTVSVIPGSGKTISWSAVLERGSTTVRSAHAG
jgi:hypothetical protein